MSGAATQNVLMFSGSMAAILTFWLGFLGVVNGSPMQLVAAVAMLGIAVLCFRAYASALRAAREQQPPR